MKGFPNKLMKFTGGKGQTHKDVKHPVSESQQMKIPSEGGLVFESETEGETPQEEELMEDIQGLILLPQDDHLAIDFAHQIRQMLEKKEEEFVMLNLSLYVAQRKKQIFNLTEKHYKVFMQLEELLTIQRHLKDIKQNVGGLNQKLQSLGGELIFKTENLIRLRTISSNIDKTIKLLNICLYVVALSKKARDYIVENKEEGDRKYYPAIKIIEQIQQTHMANINSFTFGKYMEQAIPGMKLWITKRVMDDVNVWFFKMRENAGEIGRFANEQTRAEIDKMKQREERRTRSRQQGMLSSGATPATIKNDVTGTMSGKISLNWDLDKNDVTEVSVYSCVDGLTFAPLYQCLYIYQSLGMGDQFTQYYKKTREQQKYLVLRPDDTKSFCLIYPEYFNEIAGFFIIESTVLKKTKNLISNAWLDHLWESAVGTMKKRITESIVSFVDCEKIREFKDYLIMFYSTMKVYG
eukprot:TRINITY_DN2028_c0_g1_i3.p1 TRINITY_DN2028_c0_g1~~TRINITY_DN2028_c0_g1_i3.p1  ORF type:complete len:517 (+),score=102.99 TRINITY_DN2028_c0_g1_i3:158-1552(+)